MKVRAEFYSRLREIAGARELECELPPGAKIGDLFEQLCARHPQLRRFERTVLFGKGVEFAKRDEPLCENDVIAIMPPVQGG